MPNDYIIPAACCNCGTERNDLIRHDGDAWCPNYGYCDLVFYNQQLGRDIAESEGQRLREGSSGQVLV